MSAEFDPDDTLAEIMNEYRPADRANRHIRLTSAAEIKPRPIRWLWDERIPQGALTLTPGRGGVGKSTFHAWVIAGVTTGVLPGVHHGEPRAALIAAREDSWAQTIVPRLIAAGANLDLVHRIDVETGAGTSAGLTLPSDLVELEKAIRDTGTALVSVDPLLSALSGLDSHKNADVREALEPLAAMADSTGCAVLGNAHFNKSGGADPMQLIVGSGAFGDVARAAMAFVRDDDGSCVITQVKNNLGRLDLPSLRYVLEDVEIPTEEGPAHAGRLEFRGESDATVEDILSRNPAERGMRQEAIEFLREALAHGDMRSTDLNTDAGERGLSKRTIERARREMGLRSEQRATGERGRQEWWVISPTNPS